MSDKRVCRCGWKGTVPELLQAPHPFMHGEEIYGCPACKDVDEFRTACDEPGCWAQDTCGTPTSDGYRRTCHWHCPRKEEEK